MKFSQDYVHNCFVFLDAMLRWPLFTARSAHCTVSPDLDTLPGQVRTPLTLVQPDLQPRRLAQAQLLDTAHSLHTRRLYTEYLFYFVKANEMKMMSQIQAFNWKNVFPKLTQYSRKKVESGHSQQFSSRKPKDIQEIAETYFMLFIQ